jgi:hypothetical protein
VSRRREERPVAIPLEAPAPAGSALEGLYVSPAEGSEGGAVIAPPHPLYGGSMESPVVSELAWAARQAGLAALCFNWRGVGASTGAPSGSAADADADYSAALLQLALSVPGDVTACGYSFGAAAATRAAAREPRVRSLLLVAPPPSLLDAASLARFAGRVLLVVGEWDQIASPSALEQLASALPRARFARIPEADHFFAVGLAELGRIASEWLGGR